MRPCPDAKNSSTTPGEEAHCEPKHLTATDDEGHTPPTSGDHHRCIGAALVDAYRKRNYAVVANSRTITAGDDSGVVAVAGDIADPATAE